MRVPRIAAALLALVLAAPSAIAQPPPAGEPDTRPVLRITKDQARERASAFQPGEVTAVDLERKRGRVFWVVEIQTPAGDEVDVLVDVESGQVVGLDDVDY
jgi:uncharacterized membrane protein YkoI